MLTPRLETERLILRPFTMEDVKEVFECWESDPLVAKYMMWESHNDIEKTREFMEYELSMLKSDDWYRFCVAEKESGKIIGTCLVYFDTSEDSWDISYNLGRKYWGQGYATEAMRKVLEFAAKELSVHDVVASHAKENPASGRVMEKLGFIYEHEIEYICNGGKIHTTGKQYRLHME